MACLYNDIVVIVVRDTIYHFRCVPSLTTDSPIMISANGLLDWGVDINNALIPTSRAGCNYNAGFTFSADPEQDDNAYIGLGLVITEFGLEHHALHLRTGNISIQKIYLHGDYSTVFGVFGNSDSVVNAVTTALECEKRKAITAIGLVSRYLYLPTEHLVATNYIKIVQGIRDSKKK